MKYFQQLYDYLNSKAGKKISQESFKKDFQSKKKKALPNDIADILLAFDKLKLINIEKRHIQVSSPFTFITELSIGRNGSTFALGPGFDIYITGKNKGNARHRDKVEIILTKYSRGRFEGKILNIKKHFAQKFLAQVVSKKRYHTIIKLTDQPDRPFGVINSLKISENDYFFVKATNKVQKISLKISEKKILRDVTVFEFIEQFNPQKIKSDIDRIITKYNLPNKYEAKQIPSKKELKKLVKIGEKDKNRRNLVKLFTCTIDGKDAKDFDDAISIKQKQNSTIIYVHIADVSWFIPIDSPLDQAALNRGNSYYLTQMVIPMLPEIISNDFCSLRPKTRRLTVTCEIEINLKGNIIRTDFYRSLIYINQRFTYEKADSDLDSLNSKLRHFWDIANLLLEKRLQSGRIDLNIQEIVPEINKKGQLKSLISKNRLRSHRLIEEFMLTANQVVAEFSEKNKLPILHRVHDAIPIDALEKINKFLKTFLFKYQLKSLEHKEIQKALEVVAGSSVEKVFNYLLLRSFSQAVYFEKSMGHWGLGFKHYTHFTSPIRRYSDLIVHRQILAYIEKNKYPYSLTQLTSIGKTASKLERIAMEADRSMMKLLAIRFMENKKEQIFNAFFTGIHAQGIFITIKEFPIEGFISAKKLSTRGELTLIDDFTIFADRYQKTILLGSELKVKLDQTNWEDMKLEFTLSH